VLSVAFWVGAAAGAQLVPDDNLSLTRLH
jgi:hypothetical protein